MADEQMKSETNNQPANEPDGKDLDSSKSLIPDDVDKGEEDKDAPPPEGEESKIEYPDFTVEGFPDKFLDEDGKPDWGKLVSSYGELEKKLHGSDEEDKSEQPDVPEEYELNLPEGFDDGIVEKDDPLVQKIFEVGKEGKIPQETMDKFVGTFVETFSGIVHTHKETEMEALGSEANEVVGRVGKFFAQHLDADEFEAFKTMAITSDQIKVLDKMRSIVTKSPSINDTDNDSVSPKLTEEDLRAKMREDAYYDTSHPNHEKLRREVEEGFERLYGKK